MAWYSVQGVVVRGHGVASGQAGDVRYPEGTLALQIPHFLERGLDLRPFYRGTLNVSIAPLRYTIVRPKYTFRGVAWSPHIPPEDFSFFDCRVRLPGESGPPHEGLIYYPHPETKPEHFQDPYVLEIMTSFLDEMTDGDVLLLEMDDAQLILESRHTSD